MVWNPFDPNVLAVYKPPTSVNEFLDEFVIFCSTTQHQPLVLKKFVSESDRFSTVKWISSNRIACGYKSGVLQILEEWVRSLAWNEKSKYLASCSGDRTIKIWADDSNSDSNEPVYSLKLEKLYCRSIVWYSSKEDKGEELDLIACW
ncbi:hypothetical protein DAPPUDRAFT_314087 [Daphnia pulex]|uniref:Uncharacterized protein n=1 Tax=Daphnia pulex TaxID=6669 RepID=E9G4N2_DAPPU|nr:hypothetical protein DAPPUDRAFT_314087 [Daphnia pulex]|eukprot:EFX85328.1 hypothetical protein DAPPUDRAFT_314087 [Daphnia pulex]